MNVTGTARARDAASARATSAAQVVGEEADRHQLQVVLTGRIISRSTRIGFWLIPSMWESSARRCPRRARRPRVERRERSGQVDRSDDFPTPPYPDDGDCTRRRIELNVLSSAARPRSFESAQRARRIITSKSSRTDETPSRPPTSFALIAERRAKATRGQRDPDAGVAPSIVMSRTMSVLGDGLAQLRVDHVPERAENGCMRWRHQP